MERIDIPTRCLTCGYYSPRDAIELVNKSTMSYGFCYIWHREVCSGEYCSRGEYDDDWIDK